MDYVNWEHFHGQYSFSLIFILNIDFYSLRCNYKCCNQRVRNEDFEKENTCMCGVATMRYQCDADERDICYYVNDNGVRLSSSFT